ncbi:MAG: DnaJ domain-containing protein [Betaproteobacteria bacterium]|uniref:DnaJ domain-containing protein n=1 Tax=Candidatus Proximibacter danicus TaxID=2954365 RepID=A0A9D7PQG7_9PROT|nr:DnaJ domain-containing protein [Candidatus Proximibacter danicus]MBK9447438.1 DnaJ domain-containing protein [Betaproteobacteria bacterium]
MSGIEAVVILFGLFLGYWIVSRLIANKPAPSRVAGEDEAGREHESADGGQGAAPPAAPPWHEVLDVPANAAAEEINAAYNRLVNQYHPDKVATLGEEIRTLAERKTKEITEAYRASLKSRGLDA